MPDGVGAMSHLTEKEIHELFAQVQGDEIALNVVWFARAVELLVVKKLIRAIAARVGDDTSPERDRAWARAATMAFDDMCRRVENSDGPVEYMNSRPPVWGYGHLILTKDGYALFGDLTVKVTLEQALRLICLAPDGEKS